MGSNPTTGLLKSMPCSTFIGYAQILKLFLWQFHKASSYTAQIFSIWNPQTMKLHSLRKVLVSPTSYRIQSLSFMWTVNCVRLIFNAVSYPYTKLDCVDVYCLPRRDFLRARFLSWWSDTPENKTGVFGVDSMASGTLPSWHTGVAVLSTLRPNPRSATEYCELGYSEWNVLISQRKYVMRNPPSDLQCEIPFNLCN